MEVSEWIKFLYQEIYVYINGDYPQNRFYDESRVELIQFINSGLEGDARDWFNGMSGLYDNRTFNNPVVRSEEVRCFADLQTMFYNKYFDQNRVHSAMMEYNDIKQKAGESVLTYVERLEKAAREAGLVASASFEQSLKAKLFATLRKEVLDFVMTHHTVVSAYGVTL